MKTAQEEIHPDSAVHRDENGAGIVSPQPVRINAENRSLAYDAPNDKGGGIAAGTHRGDEPQIILANWNRVRLPGVYRCVEARASGWDG